MATASASRWPIGPQQTVRPNIGPDAYKSQASRGVGSTPAPFYIMPFVRSSLASLSKIAFEP